MGRLLKNIEIVSRKAKGIGDVGIMQKKFFARRFRYYILILNIPMILIFLVTFVISERQREESLMLQANNTLSSMNTNLDLVINNVLFQNDQLTNNSHMLLALRKLLASETNISYGEAIYLRNIRTLMGSITRTYPSIKSVYIYLDGYDNFISSEEAVKKIKSENDLQWLNIYADMKEEEKTLVEIRSIIENNREEQILTIFKRMLLLDGVVVMNVDMEKYKNLLDTILIDNKETVLICNSEGKFLFSWNEKGNQNWDEVDTSYFFDGDIQGKWIRVGNQKYMVHSSGNENYNLKIVSLISYKAKIDGMLPLLRIFILFWVINVLVMMFIAYITTKRTFNEIYYLIQVFDDAEKGIYPSEPKKEIEDEYDVIMNNIIYLFLQTLKLNTSLAKKQREQEVAELAALQLQINPHFLFNTLQNVQFQIKKLGKGTKEVCGIIDSLSDILKYALSDPLEMISLEKEVEYLKKYIAIQQFRFGQEFIVYYEIDDELWETSVFRLMLQPLVENSILHGIRQSNKKGYIKLKIMKRNDRIHFFVIDNGVGMSKEEVKKLQDSMAEIDVGHIGLTNVNSRLKLYYGDEAGLHIMSKKDMGSVVKFWIPINHEIL